ncbi:MAG TPA: bi-domain-containing oxidoreductase [Verrucomicrobiae bacterium]|nr:bi-domain-containing oxidoreductase [Verrucomicrobiae bacterium]
MAGEQIALKQIAQYQDGRLELQEVPIPVAPPGGLLVRTTHSVISVGTEKMKVEQAKMNLLQKARARPDQVRKVLDTARTLGWKSAYEKVRNRLDTPTPLGYSAAGVVTAVDPGNTRFRVGDRVACAGAECAFHAEYLAMPDMLVAPVPAGVENWQAAYTTLCAIALQAVRQTEARLGDRVLVVGQGLIGLLVTNMLRASGARVMGADLLGSLKRISEMMGAERFVSSDEESISDHVRAWTAGYGVDAAIICTATDSNAPIEQAAEALRDRGRLVDVGITRIELPWKIFYEKELEVRFSRSYGPGRYDPAYEWGGQDYPIGYVRWTEQRNMEACLALMARGEIKLETITRRRPFGEVPNIYEDLFKVDEPFRNLGIVLEYPTSEVHAEPPPAESKPGFNVPFSVHAGHLDTPVDHLDVIGAGNFARTMLLPHLKGELHFGTVVNATGLSANHVRTKFGFESASTDASQLNHEGGAVLIATRHHLHAPLVKAALRSNRQVFVEKPLCLTREELGEIEDVLRKSRGSIMVGFNRRFAPLATVLKSRLQGVPGPKSLNYRVLAGKLDPQHWYANYNESGGRVLGEACHFLDFFCFLFDSRPVRVLAQTTWPVSGRTPFPDSVSAQVEFEDGSCGQLIYSAEGDPSYPKETLTMFASGMVAEITNFQELTIHRGRKEETVRENSKGHKEEMGAWIAYLRGNIEHPLPYAEARRGMLLTFAALESIRQGQAVDVIE